MLRVYSLLCFLCLSCGAIEGSLSDLKGPSNGADITIRNSCQFDIWIASIPNSGERPLLDGIVKLPPGKSYGYKVPTEGWSGRFWPKTGCDSLGQSCTTGQAIPPCPRDGCEPPADTKVEFFFGAQGSNKPPYYDISLVDGYSLPVKIEPEGNSSTSCAPTTCSLDLSSCPQNEISNIGDLQVVRGSDVVQCLSPCKKWTWPKPLGKGQNEKVEPGLSVCCPNPPVSPEACRTGIVEQTKYVKNVHETCPTAYSYAFDDDHGLHTCDIGTRFDVTFCP